MKEALLPESWYVIDTLQFHSNPSPPQEVLQEVVDFLFQMLIQNQNLTHEGVMPHLIVLVKQNQNQPKYAHCQFEDP